MKLVLVLAMMLLSVGANAEQGIAKLFLPGFNAGFEIELKDTLAEGYFFNNGYSQVKLEFKDGSWKGPFGRMLISQSSVKYNDNGTVDVQMVSSPGGTSYFTLKPSNDGSVEISGLAYDAKVTVQAKLTANGQKLNVSGSYSNISLSEKNSVVHAGTMTIKNFNGIFYSSAELRTIGGMRPQNTKKDPILFVLTHVVPYL